MKNRLIALALILSLWATGIIWIIAILSYWLITGKMLPLFDKALDFIYKIGSGDE